MNGTLFNCTVPATSVGNCKEFCINGTDSGIIFDDNQAWCVTDNSTALPECVASEYNSTVSCAKIGGDEPNSAIGRHRGSSKALALISTLLLIKTVSAGINYVNEPYYRGPTITEGQWSNSSIVPSRFMSRQEVWCGDACTTYTSSGYAVKWGYYFDANCQDEIYTQEFSVEAGETACAGSKLCNQVAADLQAGTVYAKLIFGPEQGGVLEFTRAQTCPNNSGAGTFVEISDPNSCVQLAAVNWESTGVNWYQCSKIPLKKRSINKRDVECSSFRETSRVDTYAPTVKVTPVRDCRQQAGPCTIAISEGFSTSVSTSWSTTVGVNYLFGSASVTAGQEFTETETWTYTSTLPIPENQQGYVGGTSDAIELRGFATDCSDGNEYEISATVVKANTQRYNVVLVTDP